MFNFCNQRFSLNLSSYNNSKKNNNTTNNVNVFNPNRTFYICSYGGSGSTMLTKYLSNFGNVEHIHDRNPPEKLKYVGSKNTDSPVYKEWFNNVEVPNDEVRSITVIFIYRDPIDVIYSRFIRGNSEPNTQHMTNVMCKHTNVRLRQVLHYKKDLYEIENFFNNWTTRNPNRNYIIYCIKYETFWNHINQINHILRIPDIPKLYPARNETRRNKPHYKALQQIYKNLIYKINKANFIELA
tara:strand:+ start:66 stop:785 length:720 start_codon:yes stop_codon:yes gene_type:complete